MSLVSRHLEAQGITTIVVGSARDIVEECGGARMRFVDFPLGIPCGKPNDRDMQRSIVSLALVLVLVRSGPFVPERRGPSGDSRPRPGWLSKR